MLETTADAVGQHDILLAPCSQETFDQLYPGPRAPHRSCFENLRTALAALGMEREAIFSTFNVFMNVEIEPAGRVLVRPPLSKAGDRVEVRALMDPIVGLTACSAEQSNNYAFKPIHYEIL